MRPDDSETTGHADLEDTTLTPDNPLLSRPTGEVGANLGGAGQDRPEPSAFGHFVAVNCTNADDTSIRAYLQAGIAPATRRAYRADLEHFDAWGGDIPSD